MNVVREYAAAGSVTLMACVEIVVTHSGDLSSLGQYGVAELLLWPCAIWEAET
jgi:hypothetical protein